jgi:hypothetical protein
MHEDGFEHSGVRAMDFREKALFHQIHPAKLATDAVSGVASTWLMWRHQLGLALLVGLLPAMLVSAAMLRWLSFEAQRDSRLGSYLARYPQLGRTLRSA